MSIASFQLFKPLQEQGRHSYNNPRNFFVALVLLLSLIQAAPGLSPADTFDNPPNDLFLDVARASGLDFVHFNGMSGEHYYCEMVGAGAAMFDYDKDGDLDLFLVQGNILGPGKTMKEMLFPPKGSVPVKGRLYRNDLNTIAHQMKFTDVTEQSQIDAQGYGMGVAAADIDNDGWIDLYLTNFGSNQMWRNKGDGTFADVTLRSGTDDPSWSVSAAFLDYDRDGWLDLFVGNYVNFSFTNRRICFGGSGAEDYCGPLAYDPVPNRLFHNRRDGTFEDVTAESQIGREFNGALGVVTADFNADGWLDIYVANDQRANDLWINRRNGTFKNEALLAGCAFNKDGIPESSMGVDAGDWDNDGDEDLVVTNLKGEKTTLYVNDGKGWFEDRSFEAGLAVASRPFTGFGTGFLDFDNDGWLDVVTVNGEVRTIEALARAKDPYPLHQRKQLFRNLGNSRFEEIGSRAGAAFQLSEVGRGLSFGDVDNDGDLDVLIGNNNGPARLLLNQSGSRQHWLGLRMVGQKISRDMLGTRVAVTLPQGTTLWRRVHSDGSYGSSSDPRVLVGLGQADRVSKIRAYWASGHVEEWKDLPVNRYHTLREASGVAIP